MSTLFLNPETWDLAIDSLGNIAVAGRPYAIAQDVASACMLWRGEAIYNVTLGMPYKEDILGYRPPATLLASWFRREAMRIDHVVEANVTINLDSNTRVLGGSITIRTDDETEEINAITF